MVLYFGLLTILLLYLIYLLYGHYRDIKLLKTVTHPKRGTWSERNLILQLLKNGFSSLFIFHDLYIKKSDGTFSQLDVVVVTDVGIIVVEVKDYSGWIFGSGKNEKWTQILGNMKYSFYNPVLQNEGHIRSLRNQLSGFSNIPFYSLIVFYGNCELKKVSNIPNGTMIIKEDYLIDTIFSIFQNQNSSISFDKSEVMDILNRGVVNGGIEEIQFQHIVNLKKYS